ncbi:MAG: glycoside hydrolase family 15 protein, partial [Solirubrobacteraceae bacterium]
MSSAPFPPQLVGPFVAAGRKDMVTTSLGPARVWASVGQGIPTEVYWPTPSDITMRDLGFIIADGSGWWAEVKAQASYQLQWPD